MTSTCILSSKIQLHNLKFCYICCKQLESTKKKFACTCNTISSVENRSEVYSAALTPIIRPQSILKTLQPGFYRNAAAVKACRVVFFFFFLALNAVKQVKATHGTLPFVFKNALNWSNGINLKEFYTRESSLRYLLSYNNKKNQYFDVSNVIKNRFPHRGLKHPFLYFFKNLPCLLIYDWCSCLLTHFN